MRADRRFVIAARSRDLHIGERHFVVLGILDHLPEKLILFRETLRTRRTALRDEKCYALRSAMRMGAKIPPLQTRVIDA